jgi:hypothetical protein
LNAGAACALRLAALLALAAGAAPAAQAASSSALAPSLAGSSQRLCDQAAPLSAGQQDRLLRFAAAVKSELDESGASVALVARSGLDLDRFGIRYSHAGVSLKASENGPWSVRQLYVACDEGRPRLFDQGMAGFVFGTVDPSLGHVSVILLPQDAAAALEHAALDRARTLRLIAPRYSANAYPFSLRYQNCNQWVIELLATAWGALDDGADLRERAQRWLGENRYAPAGVALGSQILMLAGLFIAWVHYDDQPEEARWALRLDTSLPSSIEAFVRQRLAQARRIELCHDERKIVVRQGWMPIEAGCVPAAGDRVIPFDDARPVVVTGRD